MNEILEAYSEWREEEGKYEKPQTELDTLLGYDYTNVLQGKF